MTRAIAILLVLMALSTVIVLGGCVEWPRRPIAWSDDGLRAALWMQDGVAFVDRDGTVERTVRWAFPSSLRDGRAADVCFIDDDLAMTAVCDGRTIRLCTVDARTGRQGLVAKVDLPRGLDIRTDIALTATGPDDLIVVTVGLERPERKEEGNQVVPTGDAADENDVSITVTPADPEQDDAVSSIPAPAAGADATKSWWAAAVVDPLTGKSTWIEATVLCAPVFDPRTSTLWWITAEPDTLQRDTGGALPMAALVAAEVDRSDLFIDWPTEHTWFVWTGTELHQRLQMDVEGNLVFAAIPLPFAWDESRDDSRSPLRLFRYHPDSRDVERIFDESEAPRVSVMPTSVAMSPFDDRAVYWDDQGRLVFARGDRVAVKRGGSRVRVVEPPPVTPDDRQDGGFVDDEAGSVIAPWSQMMPIWVDAETVCTLWPSTEPDREFEVVLWDVSFDPPRLTVWSESWDDAMFEPLRDRQAPAPTAVPEPEPAREALETEEGAEDSTAPSDQQLNGPGAGAETDDQQ